MCLLVTVMSCAKAAEPSEMPFGGVDALCHRKLFSLTGCRNVASNIHSPSSVIRDPRYRNATKQQKFSFQVIMLP